MLQIKEVKVIRKVKFAVVFKSIRLRIRVKSLFAPDNNQSIDMHRKSLDWFFCDDNICFKLVKDTLSGLRQFLATEYPLRMVKNAFDFTLKALSALNTFKFLS